MLNTSSRYIIESFLRSQQYFNGVLNHSNSCILHSSTNRLRRGCLFGAKANVLYSHKVKNLVSVEPQAALQSALK